MKISDGRKCFKCESEYHLANDPNCLKRYDRNRTPGGSNISGNNTDTREEDEDDSSSPPQPDSSNKNANGWKYIHPADSDQMLIGPNEKERIFCKFYKCLHTQKVDIDTLSHSSKDHDDKFYEKKKGGPEGNLAHIEMDTKVLNESEKHVKWKDQNDSTSKDDDDELSFVGPSA